MDPEIKVELGFAVFKISRDNFISLFIMQSCQLSEGGLGLLVLPLLEVAVGTKDVEFGIPHFGKPLRSKLPRSY